MKISVPPNNQCSILPASSPEGSERKPAPSLISSYILNGIPRRGRAYRNLLASRSDSSSVRMSPSRTGPLTLRMIWRFCSLMNSTFTWVHWPWEPVRPRTLMTRAKTTDLSMIFWDYNGAHVWSLATKHGKRARKWQQQPHQIWQIENRKWQSVIR